MKNALKVSIIVLCVVMYAVPVLAQEHSSSSLATFVGPDNKEYSLVADNQGTYLVIDQKYFKTEVEAKNALLFVFKEAFVSYSRPCVECASTVNTTYSQQGSLIRLSIDKSFIRTKEGFIGYATIESFKKRFPRVLTNKQVVPDTIRFLKKDGRVIKVISNRDYIDEILSGMKSQEWEDAKLTDTPIVATLRFYEKCGNCRNVLEMLHSETYSGPAWLISIKDPSWSANMTKNIFALVPKSR